jgi:hypothetical protein
MKKQFLTTILALVILSAAVSAATEHLIPLQGLASDSSGTLLASGDLSVRIYDDATAGNLIYSETFNSAIQDGIYDVLLGSTTTLNLDNTVKYFMEVDINGEEVVGDSTTGRQAFWPGSGDHTLISSWNDLINIPSGFADGIDNTGGDDNDWNISGNDIFRDTGNVGIGTNAPTERLEVIGNIYSTGTVNADAFSSLSPLLLQTGGVTRLFIDDTTGNVGIGTLIPGASLEIVGQIKITGGNPGAGKVLTSDAVGLATWQIFNGTPGPQGIPGVPGADGLNGTDGADGATGPQGPAGTDGLNGSQGPVGLQGIQGIPGADGLNGTDGADGATGPQGPAGTDGLNGSQGPVGLQGIQGIPGADGLNGTDGADGATGPQGSQGIPGLNGTDGAQGSQGIQGLQGIPGVDGLNGTDGTQGIQGPIGPSLGIFDSLGLNSSGGLLPGDAGARTLYNLGDVGIGILNPTEKLHVNGTVKANAFSSNSPLLLQTDGVTRIYVDDSTGDVGVGTANPSEKLEVTGKIKGTELCIGADCRNAWPAGAGDGHSLDAADGSPIDVVFVNNDGNVGVGTQTPQEKLTLSNGSGIAVDMPNPTNVNAIAVSGGSLTSNTYYFKIVASEGVGTTIGSSEVSCTVDGIINNRCFLTWDAVAGRRDYRIYKGNSPGNQDRYKISSANSFNYDDDIGSTLGTVPTVTTAYVNKIGSSNSWILRGNIGIGTATPDARLHVFDSQSSISVDNEVAVFSNRGSDSGFSYVVGPVLVATTDGNGQIGAAYAHNALVKFGIGGGNNGSVTTEYFRINGNGNVGIGKSIPTFSAGFFGLEIADGNNEAIDPVLRLTESGSAKGNFEIRSTRSGVTSGNMLQIGEGSDTFLTIRSDDDSGGLTTRGNVGIGTSSPVSDLHIIANTADDSSGIQLQKTSGTASRYNLKIASDGDFTISETGVGDRLTLEKSSSYFGVGTTDPNSKLHVDGPIATKFQTVTPPAQGLGTYVYFVTASDSVILGKTVLNSNLELRLPIASGITGRQYTIKAGQLFGFPIPATITVTTTAGQTIDGALNYGMASKEFITVVSDGANWHII